MEKAEDRGKPVHFKASNDGNMSGNAMVSQFLNVKKRYKPDLEEMTKKDKHAFRYYCYNDCAYIFDYVFIKNLVDTIVKYHTDHGLTEVKGAVVLFQGMRKFKEDGSNDVWFGRPTIIAAAYREETKTTKDADPGDLVHLPIKIESVEYDGYEHPGDGNSGDKANFNTDGNITPKAYQKVVRSGGVDDDTDYLINDVIKKEVYLNWV